VPFGQTIEQGPVDSAQAAALPSPPLGRFQQRLDEEVVKLPADQVEVREATAEAAGRSKEPVRPHVGSKAGVGSRQVAQELEQPNPRGTVMRDLGAYRYELVHAIGVDDGELPPDRPAGVVGHDRIGTEPHPRRERFHPLGLRTHSERGAVGPARRPGAGEVDDVASVVSGERGENPAERSPVQRPPMQEQERWS
jgi:hypothetical protein